MQSFYTSPALSRELAEAGFGRDETGAHWHAPDWDATVEPALHASALYSCFSEPAWRSGCRAWRLDEILHELTREREGGRLCGHVELEVTSWGGAACFASQGGDYLTSEKGGGEIVEAAGRVLLTLLRERRTVGYDANGSEVA